MTQATGGPSLAVTVFICEEAGQSCRSENCAEPADLDIARSDDAPEAEEQPWCVQHWTELRALLPEDSTIFFGPGVLELISARLSTPSQT